MNFIKSIIQKINIQHNIPIVLASDENYAKYMYITIVSILKNKNKKTFCDFYLLISKQFKEDITTKFKNLEKLYTNCKINFIEMGELFTSNTMKIAHITTPTYYRLKMADILPKNYKKAIYLDADVIVLKDLAKYFNTNLNGYYIAGVKAVGYIINTSNRSYYKNIGISDMSNYINAGVTLWNLDKIRKDNITPKLLELAKNNYNSQDQDVINLGFYKHIKTLPLKYNVMTTYKTRYIDGDTKVKNNFYNIYSKKNVIEAINAPVIIHYADKTKPWNGNVWLDEYWHYYATNWEKENN